MVGIYGIFRKSDDKCMYVGESKDINSRIKTHLSGNSHINVNPDEYYGEMLEQHFIDDKKYRLEREIFWINELNPEFNQIKDGSSWMKGKISPFRGKHHTEDNKKHFSEINKGKNNPMYGKPSANRGKSTWNKGKHFNWVNKDNVERQIPSSELDKYIRNGWQLGRLKKCIKSS